jgi:type II secretory ATPase GspE/PulE/Tfp pilus assembly ATPase PilB-like protein
MAFPPRLGVSASIGPAIIDKHGQLTLNEATGCEECAKRGHCGRLGVHQRLVNSRAIKAFIEVRARVEDIRKAALLQRWK